MHWRGPRPILCLCYITSGLPDFSLSGLSLETDRKWTKLKIPPHVYRKCGAWFAEQMVVLATRNVAVKESIRVSGVPIVFSLLCFFSITPSHRVREACEKKTTGNSLSRKYCWCPTLRGCRLELFVSRLFAMPKSSAATIKPWLTICTPEKHVELLS